MSRLSVFPSFHSYVGFPLLWSVGSNSQTDILVRSACYDVSKMSVDLPFLSVLPTLPRTGLNEGGIPSHPRVQGQRGGDGVRGIHSRGPRLRSCRTRRMGSGCVDSSWPTSGWFDCAQQSAERPEVRRDATSGTLSCPQIAGCRPYFFWC